MKKLYSIALGLSLLATGLANAQTIKINDVVYDGTLKQAVESDASASGDVITISGTFMLKKDSYRINFPANKILTIQGEGEAILKRAEAGLLLLANAENAKVTFKNLTFDGNNITEPKSAFEASRYKNNPGVGSMDFENIKIINVKQTSEFTIDQKGGGWINLKNVVCDESCEFAMNGDSGWTVRQGNDKQAPFSGLNNFCIYTEKDYLFTCANDLDGSTITIGFDPTNVNRFSSKRAIIRGSGDASVFKSGVPGYAFEREGNNKNVRFTLAPVEVTCNDIEMTGDDFKVEDEVTVKIANVGNGITYTYTFIESTEEDIKLLDETDIPFDTENGVKFTKVGALTITASHSSMTDATKTRTLNLNLTSGVENVIADGNDTNAPVEYYNLMGVRVENPANGLYIKRQGNKATKVMIR